MAITVKMQGRLGNNLFQFAAAYALALRNNDRLINFEHVENYPIYKEPCFEYKEIPYQKDIFLSGYFQSEKYFIDFKDEVITTIKEQLGFNISKPNNKISIHIRRGDYVGNECHPHITLEYINSAINYFKELGYNDKDFIVFTDDVRWCRVNLPYPISINRTAREDMELMSCCEHNIIANSSFSWWGAWLNQNPNKIVIAPKIWFGGRKANLNTKDLYCKTWIVL